MRDRSTEALRAKLREVAIAAPLVDSLELAARAVAIAARGAPFAELPTARPFDFVATPGHDTPHELLLRLE